MSSTGRKADIRISVYLAVGLAAALCFWLGDSLLDTFVFTEESFMVNLIRPEPIEAWMRVIVMSMVVLVFYALGLVKKSRKIEKELRGSEASLNEAQRVAGMGSWERNLSTGELHWSDETFRLFGLTPQEIAPTFEDFRGFVHPDDWNYVEESIKETVTAGLPYNIEFRIINKQGEVRYVHAKARVLLNEYGEAKLLRGTTQDITERVRAEEEKDNLHAQLLHSQKMEAIGRLTGAVAHDFNNLMTAVNTLSGMGKRKAAGSEPFTTYFTEINNACKRAITLTRQLSIFSRKRPVSREPVSVNDLIKSGLAGIISSLIGEKTVLEYDLSPELSPVETDRSNIEQVILNLVVNVRDAMGGGGSLTVRTANKTLDGKKYAVCGRAGTTRFISIEVTDTGAGMEKEVMDKVFEPFYTTKPAGKGSGLGLSVAYGIVDGLNGCIEVESEPGRGSVFTVLLPASEEKAESALPEPKEGAFLGVEDPGKYRGGGELILLVEDEELVSSATTRLLVENGYRVAGARDLHAAEKIFKSRGGEVALLFTDMGLPDGNGLELAAKLSLERPGLRALLFSGYTNYESVMSEIEEEGYGFIEKPFETNSLLKAVSVALYGEEG